ncbi:MAG: superoxide dismutase [Fibromonadaceae bacterium]|jgi:Fe-Mn family superoxide dismutase|nr:superoxide dismutase [Fibromonadaceae bacterium]
MPFELPKLGYAFGDLEPHYDEATVELHYSKHHATYAANFTKAAEAAGLQGKSAEEILANLASVPSEQKAALTNHGGGYYNHCFFWESLTPTGIRQAVGKLAVAIDAKWSSFEKFKDEFSAKALSHFGSGWAWLVQDQKGELLIIDTHDQICPITLGYKPITTIDIWEHAYYLKYKNVRADWIKAWWNIANWEKAEERFLTYSS